MNFELEMTHNIFLKILMMRSERRNDKGNKKQSKTLVGS